MAEFEDGKDKERESEKFREYMKTVTEHLKKHPKEGRKALVESGLYNQDGTLAAPYK